ncbi:MAG: tRNA 2'-O-methylase [Methanomassiliicoccales archaeon PtaU1.Bin124]|nr:MAG: tRNA 2'-O-methylase [Methanomassiliicoccales archaeon PtaU1.Bin124]
MSSTLPNERACLEILKEEGCSDKVIRHCCIVNSVATRIAKACNADFELVNAGSWLHDVGRSRTHGVKHVSEGVVIARARNLPEPLIRIISRHIAAGFTREEAMALGLPDGTYMPETLEEKIVCHSDNLVGDDQVMTLDDAVDELIVRGYSITAQRMKAMHEELSEACGADLDDLIQGSDLVPKALKRCAVYTSR